MFMDTITIIICVVLFLVVILLIFATFKGKDASEKQPKSSKFKTKLEKKQDVQIEEVEPPRLKERDEDKEPVIERVKLADNMRPKPEPLHFNTNTAQTTKSSSEDKYFQSNQGGGSTSKAVIGKANNSDVENIRRYLDLQGVPTKAPVKQRQTPNAVQFGTDEKPKPIVDMLSDTSQPKTVAEEFRALSPQMKALVLGDVLKTRGDTTWDDWNDSIDKKF